METRSTSVACTGSTSGLGDTDAGETNLDEEGPSCIEQPINQPEVVEIPTVQKKCVNCVALKSGIRKLNNSVKSLRAIADKRRAELRKLRTKGKHVFVCSHYIQIFSVRYKKL